MDHRYLEEVRYRFAWALYKPMLTRETLAHNLDLTLAQGQVAQMKWSRHREGTLGSYAGSFSETPYSGLALYAKQ
jgi:hypothetical protein